METYFSWTQQSSNIWGLDGPGGPRNHSERQGASRMAFWKGFWGPVRTPKIDDLWVPEKTISIIILIRSWGSSLCSAQRLKIDESWLPRGQAGRPEANFPAELGMEPVVLIGFLIQFEYGLYTGFNKVSLGFWFCEVFIQRCYNGFMWFNVV